MEENDSRFVAGHMGVDGDDVDAGLPQRLKCRPQFVFGDGEVAINHGVLVTTGKCRPSIHPNCIIQITPWILAGRPKVNLIIPLFASPLV